MQIGTPRTHSIAADRALPWGDLAEDSALLASAINETTRRRCPSPRLTVTSV
jgi:hypothetical protein